MFARPRILFVVFAILGWAATVPALAADSKISDFFGEYVGSSMSAGLDGLSERDLGVKIDPVKGGGFRLNWTTILRAEGGRERRKSYTIDFIASSRPGIYGSAMRVDTFGASQPLDAMKGEPFVWAKVSGKTLTVYALLIMDTGGYEMQIYERSLTRAGLDLKFSRLRDGKAFKVVTAALLKFSK